MMTRALLPLVGLLANTPEVAADADMCIGLRATRKGCANELREEATTPVSRRQVHALDHVVLALDASVAI